MGNPLNALNIGSPLQDSSDLLAKAMLDGSIHILNNLFELQARSTVTLRCVDDLGASIFQGNWLFTPQYTYENRHALSYSLGHAMHPEQNGNYPELLKFLTNRAEQDFYYGPLRQLRSFIVNHDATNGQVDLRMPDTWQIVLEGTLTPVRFMEIIEYYVRNEDQKRAVAESVYTLMTNNPTGRTHILFANGAISYVAEGLRTDMLKDVYDMTAIFKLIEHPVGHGLTQEKFRAYRKLVNL